jgi:hypothetical protein
MFVVPGTATAMIFENRLIYFPQKDGPYEHRELTPLTYKNVELKRFVRNCLLRHCDAKIAAQQEGRSCRVRATWLSLRVY